MSSFRPRTIAEVAERISLGEKTGYAIKDFLHEFKDAPTFSMLAEQPKWLKEITPDGALVDAFLQALAVYLAVKVDSDPPGWTQSIIRLPDPWFASPGMAIRNYLLLSSPAPFRTRNLFIDEDSLTVV